MALFEIIGLSYCIDLRQFFVELIFFVGKFSDSATNFARRLSERKTLSLETLLMQENWLFVF